MKNNEEQDVYVTIYDNGDEQQKPQSQFTDEQQAQIDANPMHMIQFTLNEMYKNNKVSNNIDKKSYFKKIVNEVVNEMKELPQYKNFAPNRLKKLIKKEMRDAIANRTPKPIEELETPSMELVEDNNNYIVDIEI